MLRLPPMDLLVPDSLEQAVALKRKLGARGRFIAGGTDLLPKLKRGQLDAGAVISVGKLPELAQIDEDAGTLRIGAAVDLAAIARDERVERWCTALAEAARRVASPPIRAAASLGGNLCLDTRCSFYDHSYPWRRALGFCLKRGGDRCQVAPSSSRCWAVQASDCAPACLALGARLEIVGPEGRRVIEAGQLHLDDGVEHLALDADELLVAVVVPKVARARSVYRKLARRRSIDFPVLGVAAWVELDERKAVVDAQVVLGAVGSAPLPIAPARLALLGTPLSEVTIAAAAEEAGRLARPLQNTDMLSGWRKRVVQPTVARALSSLANAAPAGEEPAGRR